MYYYTMSNLGKTLTSQIQDLASVVANSQPPVKETKYVLLIEEPLSEEDEKNLNKLFTVYKLEPTVDYKIRVDELLEDTDFLIIDVSVKDGLFYFEEVKEYLKGESNYNVKIFFKARHGKRLDVPAVKIAFNADRCFKDLPDLFKNADDYIRRICDHISTGGGCFPSLCGAKKN